MNFGMGKTVRSILSSVCLLVMSAVSNADVNVQVLSATTRDEVVGGATVILQRNGQQSVIGNTNQTGKTALNAPFADDNEVLLIVKKDGFSNLVVKCPCDGMTYALSPVMANLDGLRVVLSWGQHPSDLDSHVVYPGNHVFFSNKKGEASQLDVDDTSSYGPETITIEEKQAGERYVYAVHNYSAGANIQSEELSQSQAKVFVYVGHTLIKTYYVPRNQPGNLWVVFAVTESGDFEEFNVVKSVVSHERLQTAEFQGVLDTTRSRSVAVSDQARTEARIMNTQGEAAYRNGNLTEAVELFQLAIEHNNEFGQAYSNLGLTFQKLGREAEALWANRKAIALAQGSNAATTRASSHYNNGRIYEAKAQWADALREYESAQQQKPLATYETAIARVAAWVR